MEQVLWRPLKALDYEPDDPELFAEMVEEVRDEPACLPLLQFTARLLWDRRDREQRKIRRATYEALGGVAGALARHADGVLEGLTPADVRVARTILLRLVNTDGTRRVQPVTTVLEGTDRQATQVLGQLVDARLVTVRRGTTVQDGESELELVHESLIRSWGRLARWIDRSREELAILDQLGQVAALWDARGRRDEELWHGEALHEAELVLEGGAAGVPPQVKAFLRAALRKDRRLQRRRRMLALVGISLLGAIALSATVFAWFMADEEREMQRQKDAAELQRNLAEGQRAEAQREGAQAAFERGEMLEAKAKLRMSLETEDSPLARALWWQLGEAPLVSSRDVGAFVYQLAYSWDGSSLAVACQDHAVYLVDPHTETMRVLRGHSDQVSTVAFAPDGARLASGSWDAELRLWDVEASTSILLAGHEDRVTDAEFSPDGALLVSASNDGTIRIWNAASGADIAVLRGHSKQIYGASFLPDSRHLVTSGADQTVRIWDADTGRPLASFGGHTNGVCGLALTPDGERLVSGSLDGTVRVWDVASGTELTVMTGHTALVWDVDVSSDGRLAASASTDKTVRLWELDSGREVHRLEGHPSGVMTATFDPTGRLVASAGLDDTVLVWDVATGRLRRRLEGHDAEVIGVAFSPDGNSIATGSFDRTVRIWDLRDGSSRILGEHEGRVYWLGFSPDGEQLGTSCADGTARLWEVATGDYLELRGHRGESNAIQFSYDGRWVATGGDDGTLLVWDARSGRARWRGIALFEDPPRLLDHRGWTGLSRGVAPGSPAPGSDWVRALEKRAVLARGGEHGTPLCLLTTADELELWNTDDDALLGRLDVGAVDELAAVSTGCVTRSGSSVELHALDGSTRHLSADARAIALDGDQILVATDANLTAFSHKGVAARVSRSDRRPRRSRGSANG